MAYDENYSLADYEDHLAYKEEKYQNKTNFTLSDTQRLMLKYFEVSIS